MLPRLPDGETEQRRAVASGRLQIWNGLRRCADCALIVFYDSLRDGKQRRLIAKGIFPGVQLLPQKPLMLLAYFHANQKRRDESERKSKPKNQSRRHSQPASPFVSQKDGDSGQAGDVQDDGAEREREVGVLSVRPAQPPRE